VPALLGVRSRVRRFLDRGSGASHQIHGGKYIGVSGARRHSVYWQQYFSVLDPSRASNGSSPGSQPGARRHQNMLDHIGQLVLAFQPRIVVYYCGSNDISAGQDAGPIVERTKRFIAILHEKSPNTYFYYTSIHKAPEKRGRWDVVEAVNREMEQYSRQAFNDNVRKDLFLPDGLHFRPESTAYLEFSQIVKPIITKAWESGIGLPKSN
jgi:hypothetical protein